MELEKELRITEVFYSLQGEAATMGMPTIFVRLTGCPLRCNYCDSEYAFFGGAKKSLGALLSDIAQFPTKYICVTGGEPLAQPKVKDFLSLLVEQGYLVSLETSGALTIEGVDDRVSIVMDLKTPSSMECGKNLYSNIGCLGLKDQVKFVIATREDYEWARFKVDEYDLHQRVSEVLFSPSYESLEYSKLAEWILEDGLQVRMQIQMHKVIWGDQPGV